MFKLQMQLKMYFVDPFVRPCMHHNYGGLSESDACKDCVWPIILDAELYPVLHNLFDVAAHFSPRL